MRPVLASDTNKAPACGPPMELLLRSSPVKQGRPRGSAKRDQVIAGVRKYLAHRLTDETFLFPNDAQLAAEFGCSPRVISYYLKDLTPEELGLIKSLPRQRTNQVKRAALNGASLVALQAEITAHRAGNALSISTNRELKTRFGGSKAVKLLLASLTPEETAYRQQILKKQHKQRISETSQKALLVKKQEFISHVTNLVKKYRPGEAYFPSYLELSSLFEVDTVTLQKWQRALDPEINQMRKSILKNERSVRMRDARSAPFDDRKEAFIAFAKEELEKLEKGAIPRVLTMSELSEKFSVGTHAIFNWLKELPESSQALRNRSSRDSGWERLSETLREPNRNRRAVFVEKVRAEIQAHRLGTITELSTIDDWERSELLGRK